MKLDEFQPSDSGILHFGQAGRGLQRGLMSALNDASAGHHVVPLSIVLMLAIHQFLR